MRDSFFKRLLQPFLQTTCLASRSNHTRTAEINGGDRMLHCAATLPLLACPSCYSSSAPCQTEQSYIESSVVLPITLTIIVYSLLSVVVLVYFDREEGGEINKKLFWATVIKNPLAIGCITGVAANCSQIEIPLILARICEALSPAAFPVALLGIGSQLAATQVRKHVGWATIASTIKTVFAPTAGYFVGRALGLSGPNYKSPYYSARCLPQFPRIFSQSNCMPMPISRRHP